MVNCISMFLSLSTLTFLCTIWVDKCLEQLRELEEEDIIKVFQLIGPTTTCKGMSILINFLYIRGSTSQAVTTRIKEMSRYIIKLFNFKTLNTHTPVLFFDGGKFL